jgi:hypothetical protein
MKIPGFNAEASLGETTGNYMAAQIGQSVGALPAALAGFGGGHPRPAPCGCSWGDDACIQCCLCIRHGGHPWNCCF